MMAGSCFAGSGTLPERFDTPMFWTEEDMKWLEGTDLISKQPRIILSTQ